MRSNRRQLGHILRPIVVACVISSGAVAPNPASVGHSAARAQALPPPETIGAIKSWTAALALQAATWGSPIVTMYSLRNHDAFGPAAKAPPNQVWRMEDISTPELARQAGYVTPNVNVLYGFGFLDLRPEPIILKVPDSHGVYYIVEIVDMWTNAFAYVGGKTTGYGGGTFALVGPNWQGTLPPGVKRIDCSTPWVLIQPRVHVYNNGKLDLAGAKAILDAIKPVGLGVSTGKPPPAKPKYDYPPPLTVNPDLPVSALDFKDPLQFWDILSAAMNENPPPRDQISALLPMFKPLGLILGKQWDRSDQSPIVLAAMSEAAQIIMPVLTRLNPGTVFNNAVIPPSTIGNFATDYLTRAIIARIGLTANTPYEAVYWTNLLDSDGSPLAGGSRYTITFRQGIPVVPPGFWSVTLYDAATNYPVANPIDRYMVGSDNADLKKNPDGSFTIYIQSDEPGPERRSNWLPAPATGRFYLIPRAYAPNQQAIDILSHPGSWPVPPVVRVD